MRTVGDEVTADTIRRHIPILLWKELDPCYALSSTVAASGQRADNVPDTSTAEGGILRMVERRK